MSYFAKPNFIIYDEWFDDDFQKTIIYTNNKKIKTISNIHEFFYGQSNYKVGASENNFQVDIKINEKELFTNNYLEKNLEKYNSVSNKKISLLEKLTQSKPKFNISKKLIYSLSIFGSLLILGLLLFLISQSKINEQNIENKWFGFEKTF